MRSPVAFAPPPGVRAASAAPAVRAVVAAARRLWPVAALFLTVLALPVTSAAPAAPIAGAARGTGAQETGLAMLNGGSSSDYGDYGAAASGGQYDEYPVVVPKRTALLLDRLMTELKQAIGDDREVASGSGSKAISSQISVDPMALQRRGQSKGGKTYWRCYFNAVSCFKRK